MDVLTRIRSTFRERPGVQAIAVAAVVFVVYALTRRASNPYNQYVLLTDAFLHKRLFLINPPGYLEIARIHGHAFVVDPPAPTLFLLPFVAIFGTGADHVLISAGVGAVAIGFVWIAAQRLWSDRRFAAAMTVLVAFGTNFWWVSSDGGFWSFAHVSAVFFLGAGLTEATGRRRPWLVGMCVGLAGLSRLPVFLIAPLYLYLVLGGDLRVRRENVRRLVIFGGVVAISAAFYLGYNRARYGTFTDLGYYAPQYLKEPWFAHGRFDISYIPRHIEAIFFKPPEMRGGFPFFRPSTDGLALIFTTPAFLYALRAHLTKRNVAAIVALALVAIPLVTHGTTGWSQFGYRFSLDFLPALVLLTASGMDEHVDRRKIVVIGLCVLVNLWGVLAFNLLRWAG
jgi:hypothetical protein